jgi:hypothetical protein
VAWVVLLAARLGSACWWWRRWWVCERLTARQLAGLRHYTMRHLELVNRVPHPGPAAVLA